MAKADNKIDIFLNAMLSGKSQRQSYYIAYENSHKWKPDTVDQKASTLFNSEKVQERYKELLEKHTIKSIISREELLEGLSRAFKMSIGDEDTPIVLSCFGKVTQEKRVKVADLKALKGIAETIAKLEGYISEKEKQDDSLLKLAEAIKSVGSQNVHE